MSATRDRLWTDYQEHHHTPGNRNCHLVGITLIIIGLLGLLAVPVRTIGRWPIEISLLLVIVTGALDMWLDARLGSLMLLMALVLYLGARLLSWKVAALFLVGWIFQFIGHGVYEKRSPAFYKNLAHLIVGPLWVLNHIVHLRGEARRVPASAGG